MLFIKREILGREQQAKGERQKILHSIIMPRYSFSRNRVKTSLIKGTQISFGGVWWRMENSSGKVDFFRYLIKE